MRAAPIVLAMIPLASPAMAEGGATLGAGAAYAVGGPLADHTADRQARLRGVRMFVEAPGDRGATLVVDVNVWAAGWITERKMEDASGAEMRIEARLPYGTWGAEFVMGWLGGVIGAEAISADHVDPFTGGVTHGPRRRTWLGNAYIVGLRQCVVPGLFVFSDLAINFLTLVSSTDASLGTWGMPARIGVELRPFGRGWVRAAGTWSALGGNGVGWSLDAGVLF